LRSHRSSGVSFRPCIPPCYPPCRWETAAPFATRVTGHERSWGTDEFIARNAWLYVSILGAGYFISRGLAKSGSYEPDADYNPLDLTERNRDGAGDGR
jgi:hypothetical protein